MGLLLEAVVQRSQLNRLAMTVAHRLSKKAVGEPWVFRQQRTV
jgi:hypothetical protein